jgi:hypothetical protein
LSLESSSAIWSCQLTERELFQADLLGEQLQDSSVLLADRQAHLVFCRCNMFEAEGLLRFVSYFKKMINKASPITPSSKVTTRHRGAIAGWAWVLPHKVRKGQGQGRGHSRTEWGFGGSLGVVKPGTQNN